MKVYPSVSGKKIVEKSAMEPSIVWVGGVFQWGRVRVFNKLGPFSLSRSNFGLGGGDGRGVFRNESIGYVRLFKSSFQVTFNY